MSEFDIEAPEADVAEQHSEISGADETFEGPRELPLDANEADVVEQEQDVDLGEDDYR